MASSRRSVAVAYFLAFLGLGVFMPYFPLYLDHLGYVGWQIGAIVGLQPMLRWTSALGWAHVADRWRVRRRLLVLAGLCGALAVLPLLVVRRFAAVAAVSMAIGLVHGPIIPMLDATVIDHLPRLGGDYGRLRLWGSLAFVIGALASAPLVGRFSPAIVPVLLLLAAVPLAPALARLPRAQAAPTREPRATWRACSCSRASSRPRAAPEPRRSTAAWRSASVARRASRWRAHSSTGSAPRACSRSRRWSHWWRSCRRFACGGWWRRAISRCTEPPPRRTGGDMSRFQPRWMRDSACEPETWTCIPECAIRSPRGRGHATTDQLRRVHTERRPRAGEPGARGTARWRRSEEEGCQRTETAAEASGTRPPAGIGDADAARAGASTGFEKPNAPRR